MKIEVIFEGDVHAFVMQIMESMDMQVPHKGGGLRFKPKFSPKVPGVSLNNERVAGSEVIMTVPVHIETFNTDAILTFQYGIGMVVVAKAVSSVEAVEEVSSIYGVTTDEADSFGNCYANEKGIEFPSKMVEGSILLGAKLHSQINARPAIEGRPEMKMLIFQKSKNEHRMTLKFE